MKHGIAQSYLGSDCKVHLDCDSQDQVDEYEVDDHKEQYKVDVVARAFLL